MGDNNVLARRLRAGLTTHPSYNLTSLQLQQDQIGKTAIQEASNPYTFAAVMTGGKVFSGIQNLGYAKFLPYAADSKTAATLIKTGVNGMAVVGEAGIFVTTERGLRVAFEGADTHLLDWSGEKGLASAWKGSVVNFSALRASGILMANQNVWLRHSTASASMVGANQMSSLFGFIPAPQENLTMQFVNAGVLDLQMTAGMQMLHGVFPGMALPNANQIILDVQYSGRSSFSPLVDFENSGMIPLSFANGEMGIVDRMLLGAAKTRAEGAKENKWFLFPLSCFSKFLGVEAKQSLARNLVDVFKEGSLNQKNIDNALRIFPELFKVLAPEGKTEFFRQVKTAFQEAHDPAYNFRWLLLLNNLMPHLEGVERLEAIYLALEAAVSPHPSLSQVGAHILDRNLSRLSRPELMEVGNQLRNLDFQAAVSGKTVRDLLSVLAYEVATKVLEDPQHTNTQLENAARWLGQFISHPDYDLATTASHNWLAFIQHLAPNEATALIHDYKDDFGNDLSGHLHWAAFSEQQLSRQQNDISSFWYKQRRAEALKRLDQDLLRLDLPAQWNDIKSRISHLRDVGDVLDVQKMFQDKMRSSDIHQQRIADHWMRDLSPAKRWMAFQWLVGPQNFINMKGAEALRWRKWASLGLPYETGIATAQSSFGPNDQVLFVLGNHNSVGLPETLIDHLGLEEAAKYLMIHHTHPHQEFGNDINQIYPSTFVEGGAGGDLHVLSKRFETISEGAEIALSLTHEKGGSIFVLRKINGKGVLDIYTATKTHSIISHTALQEPSLLRVRNNIRSWAARQTGGFEVHFYVAPYEAVEAMTYPSLPQRSSSNTQIIELKEP